MDFSKFEKVENTFERKGGYTLAKEQEYDGMKYRKAAKQSTNEDGSKTETIEGRFYIANKFFNDNGLATNGLRQFTTPDGSETVLAVVADKDASILKLSKKSKDGNKVKNFKSPKFEAALEKSGLLNPALVGENQFFDLTLAGTNVNIKGVQCISVYTITKGVAKPKPEHKAEEVAVEQPVAEQAAPSVQAAPAADAGWN